MSVINSSDVYKIICKTLNTVSAKVMRHSQIVGYTLFKMLQYENEYSLEDIIDYTMVGILHDIGLYKTEIVGRLADYELNNVWEHSVYGHLFLRYLSPLKDKADIVLYHHLDFNKYNQIQSDHMKVCAHLAYADKLDTYHRLHKTGMPVPRIYFEEQKNIAFSARSQHIFELADEKYRINARIKDGSYLKELDGLLGLRKFKEAEIRDFLKMLVYTIDFQSEVTVLHTLATTTFATEIARLMRLSPTDAENLYYGALLHDIGKPDCKCHGKRDDDTNMHYYGHPQRSMEIVRDRVIPELISKGAVLLEDEQRRLLYYVEYHDDRVSLCKKHLKRHLQMVSLDEFKNLMYLQVADAKAHITLPIIEERVRVCSILSGVYADEKYQELKSSGLL